MSYEIHYDHLFKGRWYHMIIVCQHYQVAGYTQSLKKDKHVKNLDVQLNLE